jgi:lysozyme
MTQALPINPVVVDISSYQQVRDWGAVQRSGIAGVIHKATEGGTWTDKTYDAKRQGADAEGGFLWGAYHFMRPGDMVAEADFFLSVAAPDADDLLVLDHEDAGVSLDDLKKCLARVDEVTGRLTAIYSGSVLKEQLAAAGGADPELSKRRLWLPQYWTRWVCPPGWTKPWLWQFTDGSVGPTPHSVPGIPSGGVDVNSYDGTNAQLASEWAGASIVAA